MPGYDPDFDWNSAQAADSGNAWDRVGGRRSEGGVTIVGTTPLVELPAENADPINSVTGQSTGWGVAPVATVTPSTPEPTPEPAPTPVAPAPTAAPAPTPAPVSTPARARAAPARSFEPSGSKSQGPVYGPDGDYFSGGGYYGSGGGTASNTYGSGGFAMYGDIEALRQNDFYTSQPGFDEDRIKKSALQKANYLSQMDQFYTALASSEAKFASEMDFNYDQLNEGRRQFDESNALATRSLEFQEWMGENQVDATNRALDLQFSQFDWTKGQADINREHQLDLARMGYSSQENIAEMEGDLSTDDWVNLLLSGGSIGANIWKTKAESERWEKMVKARWGDDKDTDVELPETGDFDFDDFFDNPDLQSEDDDWWIW